MNIADIIRFFDDEGMSPDEKKKLFDATVLLTLARASASDTNIKHVEVDTVREIVRETTGEEVSAEEVRIAAQSRIYEKAPLERHLAHVRHHIDFPDRVTIIEALAKVILSDGRISSKEVRFFNMVAEALQLTPAKILGLFETA